MLRLSELADPTDVRADLHDAIFDSMIPAPHTNRIQQSSGNVSKRQRRNGVLGTHVTYVHLPNRRLVQVMPLCLFRSLSVPFKSADHRMPTTIVCCCGGILRTRRYVSKVDAHHHFRSTGILCIGFYVTGTNLALFRYLRNIPGHAGVLHLD
jgi:hypothetical protein